jgi:peptidyl-prolyl cis-trans isomerase A (cyclophilin A)
MKYILLSIVASALICCSSSNFKSKWTKEVSPDTFIARFETTKGNFDDEVPRAW